MSKLSLSSAIYRIETRIVSVSDRDDFNHYRERSMVSESFGIDALEGDVRGTVLMMMDLPQDIKVHVAGVEALDHLRSNINAISLCGVVYAPMGDAILPGSHVAVWFAKIERITEHDILEFFS